MLGGLIWVLFKRCKFMRDKQEFRCSCQNLTMARETYCKTTIDKNSAQSLPNKRGKVTVKEVMCKVRQ